MRHIRALMLGITLIALVVACAGYALLREISTPVSTSNEVVEFEVADGDSTSRIATKLRSASLIRQPTLFSTLVRYKGLDGRLQAGFYQLRPSMTMSQIISALQNSRVEDVQFTVPEGLRLEEIAAIVGATGVIDEAAFLEAARDADSFKANHFLLNGIPAGGTLEGYLFPDTYRINTRATPESVIEMMLTRFDEQYATIERDVRVPDRNVHEIMTMASVIQREAAMVTEMPQISAVFWNRLKPENVGETGNGRLQSDPTVQYALGYSEAEGTWWRKELTITDLAIESPYNTRELPGLPPGPISAPGLAAITAAAQPDESANYLYFVASCAKDGTHHFTETFEEFQVYEAEYLACS